MADLTWKKFLQKKLVAVALQALLLQCPAAEAQDERSVVSFETTFTEVPPGASYAEVRLKRFAAGGGGGAALGGVAVEVRTAGVGVADSPTGLEARFLPGSGDAGCRVTFPAVQSHPGEMVMVLEIVPGAQVTAFGRRWHVLRRKGEAVVTNAVRVNGVVFSGAGSPGDAVEGGDVGALVEGGIVALGGGGGAPVRVPALLAPRREYASGEWVPPLSPVALVLEFGTWRWNAGR